MHLDVGNVDPNAIVVIGNAMNGAQGDAVAARGSRAATAMEWINLFFILSHLATICFYKQTYNIHNMQNKKKNKKWINMISKCINMLI